MTTVSYDITESGDVAEGGRLMAEAGTGAQFTGEGCSRSRNRLSRADGPVRRARWYVLGPLSP